MEISVDEIARLDAVHRARFLEGLHRSLADHFDELDEEQARLLFENSLKECERLGVETEYGLNAFLTLSFAASKPLSFKAGYMALHRSFLRRFGTPERLPVELYDRIG